MMYNEDLKTNPILESTPTWLVEQSIYLMSLNHLEWNLGHSYVSTCQVQALSAYDMATKLDPTLDHINSNNLGYFCFYGANPVPTESVMHACNRAVEMEPNSGLVHAFRAKARGKSGDLKGAREDLEQALRLLPDGDYDRYAVEEWLVKLKDGQDPFKQGEEYAP